MGGSDRGTLTEEAISLSKGGTQAAALIQESPPHTKRSKQTLVQQPGIGFAGNHLRDFTEEDSIGIGVVALVSASGAPGNHFDRRSLSDILPSSTSCRISVPVMVLVMEPIGCCMPIRMGLLRAILESPLAIFHSPRPGTQSPT